MWEKSAFVLAAFKFPKVKLTRVLFGQFGDVVVGENVLFGGHPVPQQQDGKDNDANKD